jgi:hypothetical protein
MAPRRMRLLRLHRSRPDRLVGRAPVRERRWAGRGPDRAIANAAIGQRRPGIRAAVTDDPAVWRSRRFVLVFHMLDSLIYCVIAVAFFALTYCAVAAVIKVRE